MTGGFGLPFFYRRCYVSGPQTGWVDDMNDNDLEQSDEQILTFEVSDAALEAAANALPGAAMSMPNAPTVSIIVVCCGNN